MQHTTRRRLVAVPFAVAAAVALVGCTVTAQVPPTPPAPVAHAPAATPAPQSGADTGSERPGDLPSGARFCIDSVHLALINRRASGDIYADETIRLFPDGIAADYVVDPDA